VARTRWLASGALAEQRPFKTNTTAHTQQEQAEDSPTRSRAWRLETVGTSMRMSAGEERPTS
jgi:hypothetical protein